MPYEHQWEQNAPQHEAPEPRRRYRHEPTGGAWWSEEYPSRRPGGYADRGYRDPYALGAGRYSYPIYPYLVGADAYNHYGRPDRYRQGRDERDFWDRASDEVSSWFGDEDAERRRWRDRHRGKGPKGYKRTDERILEDVNDRLMEDGMLDASEIDVSVSDGEVTLQGTVSNRFEKRRAEDCADAVSGVTHTQNNLRISASTAAK